MDEQRREGHEVSFATWAKVRELRSADEVWIHCGWLPCLWWAALWGRNVRWMPEACYDPVRLRYHGWKKWLAGPIERFCLRRAKTLVATCEAEAGWIRSYLGRRCPPIEVTDIKRFFKLNGEVLTQRREDAELSLGRCPRPPSAEGSPISLSAHSPLLGHPLRGQASPGGYAPLGTRSARLGSLQNASPACAAVTRLCVKNTEQAEPLHLLYLGRRHPLKGLSYLESAVRQIWENRSDLFSQKGNPSPSPSSVCCELRVVSSAFGEELEKVWDWCDVLVLPTLSENFGLVIAEALERGKRVITTDGAPAWNHEIHETHEKGLWSGYGGRLIYLKGYRDGTDEERVELLKKAIDMLKHDGNMV